MEKKALFSKRGTGSLLLMMIFSSCSMFSSSHLVNGSKAPEINLPNPSGDTVALSTLKNKLVLVEFWASWCAPCRKENPKTVALFKKYQNTEFTNADGLVIYSVSLDTDKEKWVRAIVKDDLKWPYHVSDLLGWKSVAADDYGVSSIPSSFLLDQNGIIIGKNLNHKDLEKLLQMRLKTAAASAQ